MKKFCVAVSLTILLIVILAVPSLAEKRDVGVQYVYNDGAQQFQILLTWQYLTDDTLYRTWDGRTWTQITFSAPPNGQNVTVASDVYVPYYGNIYFEIRKPGFVSHAVNGGTHATVMSVYPPLKNAHSDFSSNTALCANCHITHSASGKKLINAVNNSELCKICHGPGATGSRYSVWDGTQRLKDGSVVKSNGGPVTAGVGTPWGGSVTSTHQNANGPYMGMGLGIWTSEPIDCTTCHYPHGKNNSYRLLIGSGDYSVWGWVYNPTGLQKEVPYYEDISSIMCGVCHALFNASEESGHTPPDPDRPDPYLAPFVAQVAYRHTAMTTDVTTWNGGAANPSTPLPLEKDKQLFCLTCHFPHGTVASGIQQSGYDRNHDGLIDSNDASTMLKRTANSGVCQNCHKK